MFSNAQSSTDLAGRGLGNGPESRRLPPGIEPSGMYDHSDFAPPTVLSNPSTISSQPAIDWSAPQSSSCQSFNANPTLTSSPHAHGSIGSISSISGSTGLTPTRTKQFPQFPCSRTAQALAIPGPALMTSQPSHFSQRSQLVQPTPLTQARQSISALQSIQTLSPFHPVQPIQPYQPLHSNQSSQLNSQPELVGMDETFMIDDEQPDLTAAQVIGSLKGQIDVLITAIMVSETPSSGISKGIDAVEVAHRVMTRLECLRAENDRLADLVSGKHASHLEAANARLLSENEELKAELAQMRVVGSSSR